MIAESTFIEPTTATMVATDQSTDFTNCENKSETLNVVTNGSYSFRSNAKLNNTNNETENELNDFDNADTEDGNDYSRPKKLQKSLTGNNIINQLDCDYNLKSASSTAKSSTNNPQLRQSSNKLLTNNDSNQSDTDQQLTSQSINQPTTITRRKQNLIDNEYEDNFECLISKDNSSSTSDINSLSTNLFNSPKVPPLRIVISSSTSSRNSKDVNQNSNNYVVSTSIESSSNGNVNENNKKDSNDSFYLTRSSNNQSSLSSSANNNSTQSSTIGRITTRSQRAAALNHLTSDDSQSRYSPEEFTNDQQFSMTSSSDQQPTETQSIYLNSQNLKEKESNKENKDLRRRKGRGKVQSNAISNTATTSTTSTTTNLINNLNGTPSSSTATTTINNQQSLDNSNSQLPIDDQLLTSLNQPMINLPPSGVNSRDYQYNNNYNSYNMFQNIRKQVEKRRQNMCDSANSKSNQKAPQGFKNYLLTTGNYLLESRNESERNVNPNLTIEQINVPELLTNLTNTDQLIELYKEQELEREKMKVQHLVEREKVKLSIEQEILRVHNRASLAMHNQSLPLSFTVLMKDEEIYNPIDSETEHSFDGRNLESASNQKENSTIAKNEYSRVTYSCATTNNTFADLFMLTGKSEDIGSRCRFSGRLLHSWLQDVEDKWSKIKKEILNRQRRESESLQARQRLEFEWKIKELSKKLKINLEEDKNAEKFNKKQWSDDLLLSDELVPLCRVHEEFDFS